MGSTLVPPALPSIADDLGVQRSTVALAITAYTLPGVFLAPVVGLLADRFGRKQVLLPCLVVYSIGGGLGVFASSFPLLLACRFVQGFGSAGLINLAVVILGDLYSGNQRARIIGYNAGILTVGTTGFPSLGGFLAAAGWRWTFAPFWLASVVAVAGYFLLPTDTAGVDESEKVERPLSLLKDPAVRRILVRGLGLFVLIFGGLLAAGPLLMAERFGSSSTQIGLTLTVGALCSMVAAFNAGRIRERFHPSRTLLVSFVLFALGMLAMGLTPRYWLLVLGVMLCGSGEGLAVALLQTRATEVAPPGRRGTVVAIWVSSARIGQTSGPLVAKAGIDYLGFTVTYLMFAAVALALVTATGLRVHRIGGGVDSGAVERAATEDVADKRRSG